MFGAVIFDWDGTLADTKAPILKSFHQALREVLSLDVADDFVARRIGVGAEWTFREILQDKGLPVDEKVLSRLVDVKIRTAIEAAVNVKLFAGAQQLLQSLSGKKPLALASMNNRAVIEHLVDVLDVAKFFQTIVTVDEVTKTKPDPEIFLKAAQQLGVNPQVCVVVEDSIFGVKAAKAAQMACIAVTQGAYSPAELAQANPDLIVASLEDAAIERFILG